MKKIPVFYQVFIYMMGLTFILLGVVFLIQKQFVPIIYQQHIQSDMQTEMMSLDALLMNAEEDEHESIFLNFQIRLAYQIKLYDIYGVEIFSDNPSNLRTSTVISLNNAPIIDEYFDGLIPYVLRLEKTEQYIYRITSPTEGLYQTIEALDTLYIYIFFSGLLVATLSAFIFSRNIVKPINTLKKMSESLGKASLLLDRSDEIGALSKALESLRTSLYETIEKLERELKREKSQDALSKRFIANVSHEYQTPLAVMLAAIETLHDHQEMSQKDKDKYFQMITEEAKHLERLSKDILMLAKLNILTPIHEQSNLNQMVQMVTEELSMIHKNVILKMVQPKKDIVINIAQHHLKQVLINVLDNAVTHQVGHQIDIKFEEQNDKVSIFMSNRMNPIKNDELPHLFDPFYKKDSKGHGLGLAIVKGILDAYDYDYGFHTSDDTFSFYIHFWSKKA